MTMHHASERDRGHLPRIGGSGIGGPALAAGQVRRSDIVSDVCAVGGARLVLLRAPAGFGKTTAMAQCRQVMDAAGLRTGWLTLDRSDNDLARFDARLKVVAGGIAGRRLSVATPGPVGNRLPDIAGLELASLVSGESGFALFLDELDVIREPRIFDLLRQIIERLPSGAKIVLGSRGLPDLRLGRLRARGELLEIDAHRLRFTLPETLDFLAGRGLARLDETDLMRLHDKTEGWPAALWLASLSLQDSAPAGALIDRLSGRDRSIADYLGEEVLARQTPEIRDFLLRTSILRRLDAPLCHLVAPHLDTDRILHSLAATDLVLVPVDGGDGAYRFHGLFGEFLRAQLADALPAPERDGMQAAVSRWYEAQGRPIPAIDHALNGHDSDGAARLLRECALPLLEQGRMRLLSRWLAALAPDASAASPILILARIWATGFTRGPWEAWELLEGSALGGADEDPCVTAHLAALRPTLLAMMDRHDEAQEAGRQALTMLPSGVPFADSVLVNSMATIAAVAGRRQEARRLIDRARSGMVRGDMVFNRMYAEAGDGMLDLQEGRLRQALARFRAASTASPGTAHDLARGNAFSGVPLAAAIYETGDLREAARLMQGYLPAAREVGLPDHVILAYRTMTRIAWAHGDLDLVWRSLTEFEYAGYQHRLPRIAAASRLERARLLLMQRNFHAARDEMDRAGDDALWHRVDCRRFVAHEIEDRTLSQMRFDAHTQAGDAAVSILTAARRAALLDRRGHRALALGVILAIALRRCGELIKARDLMGEILDQAWREGFVRLILDEGDAVAPLLREWRAPPDGHNAGREVGFYSYVDRLCSGFPTGEERNEAGPARLEPLTSKEEDVLRLVAEGCSNSAISRILSISDSTVRTHLRSISAKLHAKSRSHAVAVARRAGIVF